MCERLSQSFEWVDRRSDTVKLFVFEPLENRAVSEGTGDDSEVGQIDTDMRVNVRDLQHQIDGEHNSEYQCHPEIVVTDGTQAEDAEYRHHWTIDYVVVFEFSLLEAPDEN